MRTVLHADLNNFYASVECAKDKALKGLPVAVSGEPDLRHGIILAKNELAKSVGVKTGEPIWYAKQKCPGLICIKPNFKEYIRYASCVRNIYSEYTPYVEPFGLDEAWLDVSCFGNEGEKIADELRDRVKQELGITLSVGVSFNKVFAKLGSDMKKPDATTVISVANFKQKVWPLDVGELLYVGRATRKKCRLMGIETIGDLACSDRKILRLRYGKWGDILWQFANGYESSPVIRVDEGDEIKSIGNSATTPRDMENLGDIKLMAGVLSDSVAQRLREQGFRCNTVELSVRDCELRSFTRQVKLKRATFLSDEIAAAAVELFEQNYKFGKPVRSIGVRACELEDMYSTKQLSCFEEDNKRDKREALEEAIDGIRRRFGHNSVLRGACLADKALGLINPKDDHIIHPEGFF